VTVALLGDRRTPASVRLLRPNGSERVSEIGAVSSVQEAEVTLPGSALERIWSPHHLERLGRAYWRHLTRATLGLIRVAYGEDSRTVALLHPRLALLRFHAPTYETDADHGSVTWRIERGLLVAAEGRERGFLRIGVERPPGGDRDAETRVRVRMEVRNFYPWLRGSGHFARFGAWLYAHTQLRIHVLVGDSFLRSLA
jgi:hypothetical protein